MEEKSETSLPTSKPAGGKGILNPKMIAAQFKPGQSGNPLGKSGLYQEVCRIAKEATPRAIERLIELAELNTIDGQTGRLAPLSKDADPRVVAVAVNSLLDRAWGKPKDYDPKSEESSIPVIDPSQFTAKQRDAIRKALLLLLSAAGER